VKVDEGREERKKESTQPKRITYMFDYIICRESERVNYTKYITFLHNTTPKQKKRREDQTNNAMDFLLSIFLERSIGYFSR